MAEAHSLLASLGVKPAQLLSGAYLDLLAAQAGEIGAPQAGCQPRTNTSTGWRLPPAFCNSSKRSAPSPVAMSMPSASARTLPGTAPPARERLRRARSSPDRPGRAGGYWRRAPD